ncbi:MAG: DNA topoisomerase IB, partial [Thioclava sp.]|nr:DNA topoisomerase IB [Thioclava sp.]
MSSNSSSADRRVGLEKAGLVYVSDEEPGIRRVRRGRGFSYQLPDGSILDDPIVRQRIRALALPPAYHDVWICTKANGHLQATGYDARNRKQYFYHPEWQALRSQQKFDDLLGFAESLPAIRRRVERDLGAPSDEAHFLLAALIVLLDETHLRVGNRSYAKENHTYGATTLLKQHLSLDGEQVEIRFRAKGGKRVSKRLKSPRLQRILEEIADLPGRELFSWRDDAGLHRVESSQ